MTNPKARSWRALVLVVPPLAAADAIGVRLALKNWGWEPRLFVGMLLLWAALGLVLLPFAWLLRRFGWRAGVASCVAPVFLVLVLPVACHAALDSFTSVGGGLGVLVDPLPWLACLAVALGVFVASLALERLVLRFGLERPRALLGLVLVSMLLGLSLPVRSRLRGPELELGTERPNVLMVVLDTVRARSLTVFGNPRETSPTLTKLAESSLAFVDARSASNFTFTSHLAMLSGVYPSEHGAWLLDMRYDRRRAPHAAAEFHAAGYRTGAFVGTNVLSAASGINWGFEVFDDHVDPGFTYGKAWALLHDLQSLGASRFAFLRRNGSPHWFQDFQRPADGILQAALDWISEPDARPFFCMLNLYDVHWPYLPDDAARAALVRPYAGLVDGYSERGDRYPAGYTRGPADDAHLTDLYEAELLELDTKLAAFFDAVGLDETALLVVADHGEAFGEGGRYGHNDLIEPQLHVPLLVRPAGGLARAERSSAPVSGIDVGPTLQGLAGLTVPAAMRGFDLVHTTPAAERVRLVEDRDHLDARYNHFALYRDGFKFVRVGALAEGAGLFELGSDPDALHDVSAEHPELAAELEALLDAERRRWGAASEELRAGAGGAEGLGALGYLGD